MGDVVMVSLSEFYEEFPEFNTEEYKAICPIAFRQAKRHAKRWNSCIICGDSKKDAIYLLTAHLSALRLKAQSGQSSGGGAGIVASASVGEVSIGYQQIPSSDAFEYWLSSTPYGLELLALLESLTAVPVYIGGTLERVL